jgi:hypothetical protein
MWTGGGGGVVLALLLLCCGEHVFGGAWKMELWRGELFACRRSRRRERSVLMMVEQSALMA